MSPEDYEANMEASRYHQMQGILDSIYASEFGMSPIGFKKPDSIMRERSKAKKQMETKKNYGLWGEDFYKQDSSKVENDRAKLKVLMGGKHGI
jgi:hypothetical protein